MRVAPITFLRDGTSSKDIDVQRLRAQIRDLIIGTPSPSRFPIFSLPTELLLLILAKLNVPTLLRCTQVCRQFRELIYSSLFLEYSIELAKDDLIDGPPSHLTTSDRLARLRRRRRAWETFMPSKRGFVPVHGECHAYELVGGVFGKAMGHDGSFAASRIMTLVYLPGAHDNSTHANMVIRPDIGIPVRDFALDTTQDLLVLVQTEQVVIGQSHPFALNTFIHTISENKPHPQAARSSFTLGYSAILSGLVIHVADQTVALFGWLMGKGQLALFNWRTGVLLASFALDNGVGVYDHFSFISPDTYMLTRLGPVPALDIFRFNPLDTSATLPIPERVVSLLLPQAAHGVYYHEISTHTAPFLTPWAPGQTPPFAASPHARVHVLGVTMRFPYATPEGPAGVGFTVYLHNDALLAYARGAVPPLASLPPSGPTSTFVSPTPTSPSTPLVASTPLWHVPPPTVDGIPWRVWGPRACRWERRALAPQWMRYVHGARVVRVEQRGGLTLLDFGAGAKATCDPRVLNAQDVFAEDVVSALPCREVRAVLPGGDKHSSYMIDEDRIIGLVTDPPGNLTGLDVFVF